MQPNESNRRTVLKSPDLLVTGKSNLKKCDLSKDTQRMRQEGGENQRKLKNLNRQFERDILRLENSINSMDVSDKTVATEWITKLKARPPNLNEALARNYILTHLLQLTHLQIFKCKPFCRPPPQNSLSKIKSRIPTICGRTNNIDDLYENIRDNGKFLNKLPLPRDGAFFVIHLLPNI